MPSLDRPAHQGNSSSILRHFVAPNSAVLHVETSPIHFRVLKTVHHADAATPIGDDVLMASKRAFLVWQLPSPRPQLAFLREDVLFAAEEGKANSVGLVKSKDRPENGDDNLASQYYDLFLEQKQPVIKHAAYTYNLDTPLTDWTSKDAPAPDQLVVLDLQKMPEVWEEDRPVRWGGPRNPYHRVDAVPTSRRVQIYALDSRNAKHLIADTAGLTSGQRAMALFETGLTARWYLPSSAVEPGLLAGSRFTPAVGTPSSGFERDSLRTTCPYKGEARYHSVTLPDGEHLSDVAWSYPDNIDALDLRGLVAFWAPGNERLQLHVDEQLVG